MNTTETYAHIALKRRADQLESEKIKRERIESDSELGNDEQVSEENIKSSSQESFNLALQESLTESNEQIALSSDDATFIDEANYNKDLVLG